MILFGLEKSECGYIGNHHMEYRWFSKYNGARGPWCRNKDEARSGGDEHHKIILALHGKEKIYNSTQQAKCKT